MVLAILNASEHILPALIRSPWSVGDRAFWNMENWLYLGLILSVLQLLLAGVTCKAQITNELAFERATFFLIAEKGISVDSVSGFFTPQIGQDIKLTPDVNRTLVLESPTIIWRRLGSHRFERKMTGLCSFIDSQEVAFPIRYQDTVPSSAIRAIRKSRFVELRGDDPRWLGKYLAPFILIGTGIAAIISLFYLRS